MFYITGVSKFGQNFWIFGIYCLFFSLIFGWGYGRTQSIPMAVLGHTLVNVLAGIGYLGFLNRGIVHWLTILIVLSLLVGLHLILPVRRFEGKEAS